MSGARHRLRWCTSEISVGMSVGDIEVCCIVTDNGRATALPGVGCGRRIFPALVADIGERADWRFGPRTVHAALQIPAAPNSIRDLASPNQR
jgi:hypothetical protein